ncbi:hypothetical protein GCM10010399_30740 [Dactylosporangium fulvum]|uniref:Uncharacterized protein n=1 Tax=Dactylosporangium fulvum TaxID=53359 RepID=A0ABY5W5N8_9ACTN|nr:hypothetical protein [Dactylosporangium fulvum]UWP85372.1 hypothetical protein Dfulv_14510 [Dactylosporangium fulvum]
MTVTAAMSRAERSAASSMAVVATAGTTLTASEHPGGSIDWHSFSIAAHRGGSGSYGAAKAAHRSEPVRGRPGIPGRRRPGVLRRARR